MKTQKILIAIILFLAILFFTNNSYAMLHYQTVDTPTGLVTASALNVRQGPRYKF